MNSEQPTSQHGTILVVDDNRINLNLLSRMLTDQGYEVQKASNGPEALASVTKAPPDLILLDIMMPKMDGYKVCHQLKQDEKTREIPIIFISALDETDDKVEAFAAGGVDYITRPFKVAEVKARVQTHLNLRSLQENLKQKIRERDKLIAELDAFDHTVAHDLKTPITSIVGYAQLLKKSSHKMTPEETKNSLAKIVQRGKDMANIIDELLLLAGVRKKEQVEMSVLDMDTIITKTQRRLSIMIQDHQAQIIVPETWPKAIGYGPWIEEVWTNYISNAIKYGGKPPIIELGATKQEGELVKFWVRDNGNGLSSKEQNKLFTPFTRLSQVKIEGHGLGLSIVQRIVEKLGKQVDVDSEPGQGSTFSFTLRSA